MKLRKGDKVKVIAGANKGTVAEILHISYKKHLVWVDGVNIRTKHVKPNQSNPEGRIDQYEAPIDISNVAYYDEKNKVVTRIGFQMNGKEKERISRKTKLPLGKSAKTTGGVLKKIIKNRKNVGAGEEQTVGDEKATKAAKKSGAKKKTERKAPANAKGGAK